MFSKCMSRALSRYIVQASSPQAYMKDSADARTSSAATCST
jgi:hypothetical protein